MNDLESPAAFNDQLNIQQSFVSNHSRRSGSFRHQEQPQPHAMHKIEISQEDDDKLNLSKDEKIEANAL